MIWPFSRKPKPLNPGPINEDWRVGDLAECVVGGESWMDSNTGADDPGGPELGDVCRVVGVRPRRTKVCGDGWYLELAGFQPDRFCSVAFRKVPPLNSKATAEFTAQIKAIKPKERARRMAATARRAA